MSIRFWQEWHRERDATPVLYQILSQLKKQAYRPIISLPTEKRACFRLESHYA